MTQPSRWPPRPGVVVGNPGGMRWMRPMATAFAEADMLKAYVTTVAGGSSLERLCEMAPGGLAGRLEKELALRPVPTAVEAQRVHRVVPLTEVVRVLAQRAHVRRTVGRRIERFSAERFDRAVSSRLEEEDDAVVGSTGKCLWTLARAKQLGVKAVLDYPTAHHDYAGRLLSEEARRTPAYASTLQFHDLDPALRARLDEELELADLVIVLGSFQWRSFVESGIDPAKLVQIPLGVELDQFQPIPRDEPDGRFRILFAGQLTQRKGLSYLVDAFGRADIPGAEPILLGGRVGNGTPWAGNRGVRHHGPVPFTELPGVYHEAEAFVLPSLIEGFPQTALQAMASGLPVIVSENTFGEDVISDGLDGYVVPIRDSDAIAERLEHLHANPDLRLSMSAAARKRAQQFSWERYGERVVAAVRGLTAAG